MAGGLFPVLDADIAVAPAGQRTQLTLAGAYRPPLGRLWAGLDRAALHRVADATIRALVVNVARALTAPAAGPNLRPAPTAASWCVPLLSLVTLDAATCRSRLALER
jgi:hypothetical protein